MSAVVGYISVILSCIFWGSNFVPVKEYPTGDGIFFQWVMCTAIFVAGLIVNLIRHSPRFEPLMLLGGFFWCTGNILVVLIVRLIGLGLGLLIWGISCLVMSWASGRFGLFGLNPQSVKNPTLNYLGVIIAVLSAFIFTFIKPTQNVDATSPRKTEAHESLIVENKTTEDVEKANPQSALHPKIRKFLYLDESAHLRHKMIHYFHLDALGLYGTDENGRGHCLPIHINIDSLSQNQKRILGCTLAALTGCLYGVNFLPAQYIIDHNDGTHSTNAIDYVFSHFCGIFLTSTGYFILYGLIKKNKPDIYPEVALPGFISGIMWSIAQISYFLANENIGLVITSPLTSVGPGLIASLWSLFLFKEIQGKRNIMLLCAAFTCTLIAVLFIALSNIV